MTRRILVVDDDHAMVRTLRDILTLRGWDTSGAHSGEEALRIVCDQQHPLVLMDIRMPGMDGVAAVRAMKQCSPATRVVLMTAHTATATVDEATRDGASRVLIKPIDLPALMAILEQDD